MKRNLSDNSSRSTAGCLPVPLFNQKKRTRQPLTSNPLKNEPSTSTVTHSYDFSARTTELGWEIAKPELAQLQKTTNSGQIEPSMAPSLLKQQNTSKPNISNTGKNLNILRAEEKNTNAKVWNRNEHMSPSSRINLISDSGIIRKFENISNSLRTVQQHKLPDHHKASQHIETTVTGRICSSKAQWPVISSTTSRSLQDHSPAYKFKHNIQQNKVNEKQFDHVPEDKMIQKVPAYQLKLKENDNSLRIISAVIESMKHWSQYTYKTALLFEVLGTLDSAVTPGAYGAKSFVLRDGKESLPCVFYEIDRELPRLIRGRVHRCMGNYDTKRNIFKCVSVRPATVVEQRTFQEFVKTSDVEMREYVKTMNEV
ncbi:spermatogenesis-associated protein 22 [Mauremys reevesii]|uniref:spermatogenesis-associated protein 22 n=1 Tax=Mauremys reevesii TaxID=260615 RepID=UPI00193FB8CB|nr:spermatogenesis-associated protein 22 [Mauremys reevesii]XP_039363897.1 spermatogenesis-associated protein 22 [Mauremys reevesii]XP_039363898.1 spermatogenesis-associated protein 22 [Mauremys reevesii]XP_039363899.1 spermatogenesis-associated protein 22 [Mauremys reevesii]XP_039363900.1 spermatogenesis-associated protein 22 [Mauremys reevesii]XP_039363901.1 spermatogenesis-associated protein 22 [Mauremys reevesii]